MAENGQIQEISFCHTLIRKYNLNIFITLLPCCLTDFLLSQPVQDRRQFYRTASYVPLDDIPVWTPLAGPTHFLHYLKFVLDFNARLHKGLKRILCIVQLFFFLCLLIMFVILLLNVPRCVCVSLIWSAVSEKTLYQRNDKLDGKISLYSGDITKLEIDAIVNAGMFVRISMYFCYRQRNEWLWEWELRALQCDALKP